jgi:hypothetical protein
MKYVHNYILSKKYRYLQYQIDIAKIVIKYFSALHSFGITGIDY